MNKTAKALALYTHTHTNIFSEKWSKGGSREQLEVSRLPRDCEWYQSVDKLKRNWITQWKNKLLQNRLMEKIFTEKR